VKQKTIELETILNKKVDFGRLSESIKSGFELYFNAELIESGFIQTEN